MKVRCTGWAALLAIATVVCAAPASADATDDAVINALAKRNIPVNDDNRDVLLAEAHMVCDGFDKHYTTSALAMKIVGDTDLNVSQASFLVGLAVSAYCPEYKGRPDS
ncbi:DUF732 domain-containing protein [Candidatus Mycobacterium wuenschmannii]|uniref:DUF732 domain-containing protein n=1 Tax=Candidatus Mycobacterium wuenschmannii TaxID=3027808 RepID=A0ABY8VQG0_9MYCO|nr:DUF732 domain-containing protein [Candidatus Mycobacterium wuenschmannii]WIM85880.1 DUF732 domain-containing protein [Candidatus Mycobacterium wuenschmannii]